MSKDVYDDLAKAIAEQMSKEIDAYIIEKLRRESMTQDERDMEDVYRKLKYPPHSSTYTSNLCQEISIEHINVPTKYFSVSWDSGIYESKKN